MDGWMDLQVENLLICEREKAVERARHVLLKTTKMSAIVDLAGRALWPVVSAVKEVGSLYSEINPATLSGAIDIVVIKQENGDWVCSPFHVRFGKLKLFRPSEKLVGLYFLVTEFHGASLSVCRL